MLNKLSHGSEEECREQPTEQYLSPNKPAQRSTEGHCLNEALKDVALEWRSRARFWQPLVRLTELNLRKGVFEQGDERAETRVLVLFFSAEADASLFVASASSGTASATGPRTGNDIQCRGSWMKRVTDC